MKYLLFILFILGCSNQKTSQEIDTVSLKTTNDTDISIDTSVAESEIDNQLVIDETLPVDEEKQTYEVSLIHYSTLYSSLAIFYYLKELEQKKIKLNRIVSNGFAFLIATLYAKDKNLSTVEWKLFGLLKNLSSEKIYTKGWIQIIEDFASEEFGGAKLSSLALPVNYPILIEGEVHWNRNITIKKAILDNINLLSKQNYLIRPQIFDHKIRSLSNLGHIHSIAFLDKKIRLNLPDGFVWGLMTNYLSFVKSHPNIQFIYSEDPQPLDVLSPMTKLESMYRENISLNIKHLIEELDRSNDLNSTSSF